MGADAGGFFCETNPIDDASWGFGLRVSMICERASPGFRDANWEFGARRAREAEAMGADGGGFFAKRIQSMTQVGDLVCRVRKRRGMGSRWRWVFCETNPIDDASWGFGLRVSMICERASPGFRDASWEFGARRAREAEAMGADGGGLFCETNPIDDASWGFGVPRAREAEAMGADGGGFFAKRIQSVTQVGDLVCRVRKRRGYGEPMRVGFFAKRIQSMTQVGDLVCRVRKRLRRWEPMEVGFLRNESNRWRKLGIWCAACE